MAPVDDDTVEKRRGCTFRRNDFFPKESFKSWEHYGRALTATPARLKDWVLNQSTDQTELVEIKSRRNHEMKKTLNWWDLIWFGIGSDIFALFSVFCYTEFAVEIPVADLVHHFAVFGHCS